MFLRTFLITLLLAGLNPGLNLGLSNLNASAATVATPATVTVKPGDTLYKIARRSGISVAQLKSLNGLKDNTIRVGQVLRVSGVVARAAPTTPARPAAARPTAPRTAPRAATPHADQGTYTVKSGDSLGRIATRYGVSVGAIQAANNLPGTVIQPGQRLRIPPRGTGGAARQVSRIPANMEVRLVYTYVRVGLRDTPPALASKYSTTISELRRINNLGSVRLIVPGMKLLVPSRIPVPIPPRPQRRAVTLKRLTPLNIPVEVLNIDLRHRDVLVAPVLPSARDAFGVGARVGQLARRSSAQAMINGSYFHPQTYAPAGDIVMQGRLLTWGRIPMALAITPDNRATIRASTTPLLSRPLDTTWAGMETVIATGPRIVAGGRVVTNYGTVFRDPALFGKAARSAVGLSSSRDLIMVTTHAKLSTTQMGQVMARLGVRDALLLDGGSSAGMAWNGSPVLDSVRKVSYGIGVFTNYTGRRYAR